MYERWKQRPKFHSSTLSSFLSRRFIASVLHGILAEKLKVDPQRSLAPVSQSLALNPENTCCWGKSNKNALNFDLFVDIERNFILSPPSARIEPGFSLEIKCTLPNATPPAVRTWLKNGQKIEQSSQVTITQDGKLIIHSAKIQDSGNYSCVAKNIVARKTSNPVPVIVRSEKRWSDWSACNADCLKFRHRNCNAKSPDDCHGKEVETAECKDGSCEEKIAENSDRIIYFSLIIVSVLCVILAALFAHSKRKKPEIPDYIVTDNGERHKLLF